MEIYKNSWGAGNIYDTSTMEVFTEDGIINPLNKYGFVNSDNEALDLSYITPPPGGTSGKIYYSDANKVCSNIAFYHSTYYGRENRILVREYSYNNQAMDFDGNSYADDLRIYTIIIPTLDGLLFYLTNSSGDYSSKAWKKFELNQWFCSGNQSTKGLICYFNSINNKIGNITCKDFYGGGTQGNTYPIYRIAFKFSPNETFYFANDSDLTTIDRTITDYPYFENYKSNHNKWDYVNYNSNTCVLAKVIYNNQYINNLYYIITAPFELPFTNFTTTVDPNFKYNYNIFSFNGHTYFNFFGNLAVELPN